MRISVKKTAAAAALCAGLAGSLFAAGVKEAPAGTTHARVVAANGSTLSVRYANGVTQDVSLDNTTISTWPKEGYAPGDSIELVSQDGKALYVRWANPCAVFWPDEWEIGASAIDKPEKLDDRFSYTYGWVLFRTMAQQGLFFDVGYFVRGAADATMALQGATVTPLIPSGQLENEINSYEANVWSVGLAPAKESNYGITSAAEVMSLPAPAADASVARFSYSYGYLMSENMGKGGLETNPLYFGAGIVDAAGNNPTLLTEQEMGDAFTEFQNQYVARLVAENKAKADAFFAANGKNEGVVTTGSGLQYQILADALGDHPTKDDIVSFHYILKDLEGNVIQDSRQMGTDVPVMPIGQLVDGLVEGIPLMPVGATYRFWLPSDIAYGDQGSGDIQPGQALTFDIELVGIEPKQE